MSIRRRRDIPFSQRFCHGIVDSLESDCINIQLPNNITWAETVRVQDVHLPGKCSSYKVGQDIPLFLIKASHEKPEMYHASVLWADREQNPWLVNPPKIGDLCIGTAIQFLPDPIRGFSGIFLRLDDRIDALLRLEDIPGKYKDIQQIIDIGDKIQVQITQVNKLQLQVAVSVRKALVSVAREEKALQDLEYKANFIQQISKNSWALPASNDCFVAICTPSIHFSEHLRVWLEIFGIESDRIDTLSRLERMLQAPNHPTHIILSAKLWPPDILASRRFEKQLLENNVIILWLPITNETTTPSLPEELLKIIKPPLDIREIISIIINENWSTLSEETNGNFLFHDFQRRRIQKLLNELLEKICKQHDLDAALWVVKERKDVYTPRAFFNIDEDKVDAVRPTLSLSVVATCFTSKELERCTVGRSGPLKEIAPRRSTHVHALPLQFKPLDGDTEVERALVFFHRLTKTFPSKGITEQYQPILQAYIETLAFAIHNESLAAFASLGMNSAAYLHEVGVAAQPLLDSIDALIRKKKLPTNDSLLQMRKEARHLVDMTRVNLDGIRKISQKPTNIHDLIKHTCHLSSYSFARHDSVLQVYLPDYPLTLSLPNTVIDQAMRNLLNNALFFVKNMSGSGRVTVRVQSFREMEDFSEGVCIDVEDNGCGIRASMWDALFSPRFSDKGEEGTGMGLYISRSMLRAIGGDLKLVKSIRWKCTCFRICLPMRISLTTGG